MKTCAACAKAFTLSDSDPCEPAHATITQRNVGPVVVAPGLDDPCCISIFCTLPINCVNEFGFVVMPGQNVVHAIPARPGNMGCDINSFRCFWHLPP